MRNEMNRTSSQSKTSEYQRTRPRREKTGCRVRASSHGSPEPDLGRAPALLTRTCARPPGPQPQACQAQLWGPPCPSPAVAAEARAWTPQPAGQGPAGVAAPRDPAASFDSGRIALPDPSSPFPQALGRGTLNRCLLSSPRSGRPLSSGVPKCGDRDRWAGPEAFALLHPGPGGQRHFPEVLNGRARLVERAWCLQCPRKRHRTLGQG